MELNIYDIYRKVFEICYKKQSSHVGSNLSVVPILYDIYKNSTQNDIVILSKGHAAAALYSVLLLKGAVTEEEVNKNYCGHITTNIPGVFFSTGSLGHGLSIAVGAAIGAPDKTVHVILSDGELDEGSTMEAIKYIDQNENLVIKNLRVYIDNNGFSATKKVLPTHFDKHYLYNVRKSLKGSRYLPASWIGLLSHYKKLSRDDYDDAMKRIERQEKHEKIDS